MWFVIDETIVNPETQKPLLHPGLIVGKSNLDFLAKRMGLDNVRAYVCVSERAAQEMSKRISNREMFAK